MNIEKTISRVVEVIRLQHLAYSTEQTYTHWISRYCSWLIAANPCGESRQKVEQFLTMEARRGVSASTQNQAFNAILFLYKHVLSVELGKVNALRAKRPEFQKHAPSREEVVTLLRDVKDEGGYPTRLVVFLLYGCGLRVNEPLAIRLKDVNLKDSKLVIREPKHGHDRKVSVPCSLVPLIKQQIDKAADIHALDLRDGVPVPLPGMLDKKYPRARFDKGWAWLFPMLRTCRHPRTGETVRWHMLDQQVQRAVRHSVRRTGLSCTISPHSLRHAYATHALNSGSSIRDIQVAMGHKSIETTMNYCTSEIDRVKSPLESLMAVA